MTNLSVTTHVSPVRSNFSYQRLIFDCRCHEVDKFRKLKKFVWGNIGDRAHALGVKGANSAPTTDLFFFKKSEYL